jgi:hypothetical protein
MHRTAAVNHHHVFFSIIAFQLSTANLNQFQHATFWHNLCPWPCTACQYVRSSRARHICLLQGHTMSPVTLDAELKCCAGSKLELADSLDRSWIEIEILVAGALGEKQEECGA